MKFKGIMPALVTPLNSDETINTQALDKLMSYLLTKGADGFYVGGATGEGIALKTENRAVLAEASVLKHACPAHIVYNQLFWALPLDPSCAG